MLSLVLLVLPVLSTSFVVWTRCLLLCHLPHRASMLALAMVFLPSVCGGWLLSSVHCCVCVLALIDVLGTVLALSVSLLSSEVLPPSLLLVA